ncbi:hypothetical protein F4860DRAFT_521652 [Xylaria cubensis]|nr:hypothetical protein F4860DRAFT_521652 [Xylaria cubensis]
MEDVETDSCSIIHQNHSWSPLNTSLDAIRKLMTAYKISPILLDSIRAFGSKVTGDDDPYFNFYSFKTDTGGGNGDYELCYLLRTYERHGRNSLKDPWSLRQMAVYERFNAAEGRSVWILIQPFASAKSEFLRQYFSPQASRTMGAKLHGLFLGTALANWRWYLNDQRRLVNVHNEKAVFSQATPKAVDYDTGFSDCQKLHQLAWNLSLGEEILTSYSHIVQMLQSNLMTTKDEMLDTIRHIHSLVRNAAALRKNSERTSKLLLRLLEYRRSEVSNAQTATLAVLLQQANSQNLQLNDLIQKSRLETRSTTFLTYIATFYLPATLIAVGYSLAVSQLLYELF